MAPEKINGSSDRDFAVVNFDLRSYLRYSGESNARQWV
jgi:hypothetical protein